MNLLRPTRRQFLAGTAAIAASGVTGISPSFAQSTVDWKKYVGTTLEVNLIKSLRGEILQKYQKEFEELTGHQGQFRADAGTAAAPESGDRAGRPVVRLRRYSHQLSRSEASI